MSFLLATECILGSIALYAYRSINQNRFEEAQTKLIKKPSCLSNKIQTIFESVLKEVEVDKKSNIKLLITNDDDGLSSHISVPHAFGNSFSKERGVIVPLIYFRDESDEYIAFVFKHEIAHIQKNHLLKIPSYSFLAGSIPLVASCIYPIHPIASIAISALSTIATIIFYTRSTEIEADAEAAQQSSKKAIQLTMLSIKQKRIDVQSLKQYYKKTNNWRHHLYSEEGNILIDLFHPPLSTIQRSLEGALRRD